MPRKIRPVTDPFVLYSASVQSMETDIDFVERVYRRRRGKPFHRLREDFCATGALCCEWVSRHPGNRAWGLDIDEPTLAWGRRERVARLDPDQQARLQLMNRNVLTPGPPEVDAVIAFNFSYWCFKERATLLRYFRTVRSALARDGVFVLDLMGGMEAMGTCVEKRRVSGEKGPDGQPVPAFTYVWEQKSFNPVDHHFLCYIHFHLPGGRKLQRAFTYDWRFWTSAELRDLLFEAGFTEVDFFVDGFDEDNEGDGIYRKRVRFENQSSWIAYLAAYK